MANQNYIGENGIVTQSLSEIIADITAKFQSIYGADINIDQNSPDGQLINILAQEKKDILDLCVQFYNNLDTERVSGIPQQILYKLNGLIIKAFTYSYVDVNVSTTQSVNLTGISNQDLESADVTGYTLADTNGNRWILTTGTSDNTITIPQGTTTLNFRAAELGSVTALPNTITIMETVIAGVQSVTNPANNYITGATGELDSEFRLRRNRSVTMPSQGFTDSLQAQLLTINNVTQARVYDNKTSSTVDGIPAHTVWTIVEGGANEDIGKAIYNNIPPGIPMKGNVDVSVPRPNGDLATISFDRPTAVPLYIEMKIKVLSGAIDEDYIKQELAKITYEIGQDAESVNIGTFVKEIITTAGTPYDIGVSTDGVTFSEVVTPSGLDEYFSISTSNLDITVVS